MASRSGPPKPPSKAQIEAAKIERDFLFQMQAAGIPRPIPEIQFAFRETGIRWKFDYAWPELWTCVEIEGGSWDPSGGRHTSGAGFMEDCLKYDVAGILGWCVIRVTHRMITNGTALRLVKWALLDEHPGRLPRPQRPGKTQPARGRGQNG